jgi:hypothetical protein
MAEATRIESETEDMATIQLLALNTATLEATEVLIVHHNCEDEQ